MISKIDIPTQWKMQVKKSTRKNAAHFLIILLSTPFRWMDHHTTQMLALNLKMQKKGKTLLHCGCWLDSWLYGKVNTKIYQQKFQHPHHHHCSATTILQQSNKVCREDHKKVDWKLVCSCSVECIAFWLLQRKADLIVMMASLLDTIF